MIYSGANASSAPLTYGPDGNVIRSTYHGDLGTTGPGATGFTVELGGVAGCNRAHAIAVAYRAFPTTQFSGGDLLNAAHWSHGLPAAPVIGTSALDVVFNDGHLGVSDWLLNIGGGVITAGQDWHFMGASQITLDAGTLNVAANWSNGLPGPANPGTIAVDGFTGVTDFNFGAGSVANQVAATITSSDGFNLTGGTWNLTGGGIEARYVFANSSGAAINLGGGTVTLRAAKGNQHLGAANGGTWNLSDAVVLDATHANQPLQTAGTLNIASGWSGSWTYGTRGGNAWRDLFLAGTIKFDGQTLDLAGFEEHFEVIHEGRTLRPASSSPVARFPSPPHGAQGVPRTTTRGWSAPTAYPPTGFEVYFGPDPEVRADPKTAVSTNAFTPPGRLAYATAYYWRWIRSTEPPSTPAPPGVSPPARSRRHPTTRSPSWRRTMSPGPPRAPTRPARCPSATATSARTSGSRRTATCSCC